MERWVWFGFFYYAWLFVEEKIKEACLFLVYWQDRRFSYYYPWSPFRLPVFQLATDRLLCKRSGTPLRRCFASKTLCASENEVFFVRRSLEWGLTMAPSIHPKDAAFRFTGTILIAPRYSRQFVNDRQIFFIVLW